MSIEINLAEKNIMITGAGGGIGMEIVTKFLEAGANCICLDKNLKKILKNKIYKKYFDKIILLEIDFEKKNFINILEKKLKKKIKINTLINSAGFTSSQKLFNYKLDDWNKTLKINLTTPFILSQLISKNFMNSGGSIINITSLAAEQGFPNNVAYVASKGGLKQLTKALAMDLSEKGIRVNSVGPGYVKTKMTQKSWLNKTKRKNRSDRIIMNRWANPKDIANACLFLSSELANYVNGQDIYVDGGWLSKGLKNDKI
jgi:NAD(P)-dependent dehydrogenase (short-subunit alcohol dehydrogenase family)